MLCSYKHSANGRGSRVLGAFRTFRASGHREVLGQAAKLFGLPGGRCARRPRGARRALDQRLRLQPQRRGLRLCDAAGAHGQPPPAAVAPGVRPAAGLPRDLPAAGHGAGLVPRHRQRRAGAAHSGGRQAAAGRAGGGGGEEGVCGRVNPMVKEKRKVTYVDKNR